MQSWNYPELAGYFSWPSGSSGSALLCWPCIGVLCERAVDVLMGDALDCF